MVTLNLTEQEAEELFVLLGHSTDAGWGNTDDGRQRRERIVSVRDKLGQAIARSELRSDTSPSTEHSEDR